MSAKRARMGGSDVEGKLFVRFVEHHFSRRIPGKTRDVRARPVAPWPPRTAPPERKGQEDKEPPSLRHLKKWIGFDLGRYPLSLARDDSPITAATKSSKVALSRIRLQVFRRIVLSILAGEMRVRVGNGGALERRLFRDDPTHNSSVPRYPDGVVGSSTAPLSDTGYR